MITMSLHQYRELIDACAELAKSQRSLLIIVQRAEPFIPLNPRELRSGIEAAEAALAHAVPVLTEMGVLECEPSDAPEMEK